MAKTMGCGVDRKALQELHNNVQDPTTLRYLLEKLGWAGYYEYNYGPTSRI